MALKLRIQHWELKLSKVYINDDPGLTLTYLMARSTLVTYVFKWGKTVLKPFDGEKETAANGHLWL